MTAPSLGTRLLTFGQVDAKTAQQMQTCLEVQDEARGVLCADNHLGYSAPIGSVVAYRDLISPSAVGYDIGCGNMAVKTGMPAPTGADLARIMDDIARTISFGVGRANNESVDHPILDAIRTSPVPFQRSLLDLAAKQLGTVGSGNHYVDLFEDRDDGLTWIGVHFGSRGFGHKTATWALEQAGATSQDMMAPPVTIPLHSALGADYLAAMKIAGGYARAGRAWVAWRVRQILGARWCSEVHNHHNFAWREEHGGTEYMVHRKGATPAFPGQQGFVGGSMGDDAVILEGVRSSTSEAALYSTVHGAGRAMSRRQAAGKRHRKTGEVLTPGLVDFDAVQRRLAAQGIELRGGAADEAPEAYKRLPDVLAAHEGTVRVLHRLRPIGVAMAGSNTHDPYGD